MRGRERTPQALFAYDSLVQKLRSTLLAILRTKATGVLENEILTTFSLERTSSFWKVRAFLLLHFGKEVRPHQLEGTNVAVHQITSVQKLPCFLHTNFRCLIFRQQNGRR